jgi:transposase
VPRGVYLVPVLGHDNQMRYVRLAEVSAVILQQSLADLNTAYRNFFASVTGRRKGPELALPRFRSRKDRRQAIRFTANARFAVTSAGKLRLPKIGDVPVRWSRRLPSTPSSVTVILDAAGRYFASFVGRRRGPGGERSCPDAAGQVGARCRMGGVRAHA